MRLLNLLERKLPLLPLEVLAMILFALAAGVTLGNRFPDHKLVEYHMPGVPFCREFPGIPEVVPIVPGVFEVRCSPVPDAAGSGTVNSDTSLNIADYARLKGVTITIVDPDPSPNIVNGLGTVNTITIPGK